MTGYCKNRFIRPGSSENEAGLEHCLPLSITPLLPETGGLFNDRLTCVTSRLAKGWNKNTKPKSPATPRQSNFTAGFFNQAVMFK